MQYHSIELHTNRYLLLAWLIYYLALGWVIGLLPLGALAQPVYLLLLMLAGLSLVSRVLLLWPEAPRVLEVIVNEHGLVQIDCDQLPIAHWWFAWYSRRLVVLMVFYDSLPLRWLPRFVFWLSPHNTDEETHRHLRIIARFGRRLPLHIDKRPKPPATNKPESENAQPEQPESKSKTR